MQQTASYTYEDYARLPEGAPYQLVGGQFIVSPSPSPLHQAILLRLAVALDAHARAVGNGQVFVAPIDVYLSDQDTYQPDIIYLSSERLRLIGEQKIEGAPDLVVEILSPSTAYYDLRHKMGVYERHGVGEYWIVDPMERSIEVFMLTDGAYVLHQRAAGRDTASSLLLAPLRIELDDLFRG